MIQEYIKNNCIFNADDYTGIPDSSVISRTIPVSKVIERLDALFIKNMYDEAESFLCKWIICANAKGDWKSHLSLLSELIDLYRSTTETALALEAIKSATDILKSHNWGNTVQGATVLWNIANALNDFGCTETSVDYFNYVLEVYSSFLEPNDCKMARLYNDLALSYFELNEYTLAERFYDLAINVVNKNLSTRNDDSTYHYLAQVYGKTLIEIP